jgi:ABC-type branched-subunit amino acid transport system substrate-binding protein
MLRLSSALLLVCAFVALGEPKKIQLGMSVPLTGNASGIGQSYKAGAELAIEQFNKSGGVDGIKIELLIKDDEYEPELTVANTRQFILQHNVLALFGYVGTPTSSAILPLLQHYQIPFIAPFTGASLLRQPNYSFIYHLRSGYYEETQSQVDYLLDKPDIKVGLLLQADEFGASVEQGYLKALQLKGISPTVTARFQRNSTEIRAGVLQLQQAGVDLVFMVGTYRPLAEAISFGRSKNYRPQYATVSFAGLQQLSALLDKDDKVMATMVVPKPTDTKWLLVREYQRLMIQQATDPLSDVGLEGFAAGTLLGQALRLCALPVDRLCLLEKLRQQKAVYDFPLLFDPSKQQASQQVFRVQVTDRGVEDLR